jgi:Flp pilus assembly secretin CpaC
MSSRMMVSIALLLITSVVTAQEPAKLTQQQLLQQKCMELDRLQDEIKQLRQATGTPEQIRVDVQMLEVNLTKLREKGIDTGWFANGYVSESDLKQLAGESQPEQLNDSLQFVNWLRRENLAKTLADPTVVVVSDQQASLHVGGEFPIPNDGGAKPVVGFRRFGTELKVAASALGDNQVRLDYKARVSEIDHSHVLQVDGEQVPGLRVREFDSGCQLSFGESVIMAGLVQNRVEAQEGPNREVIEKTIDVGLMLVITPVLFEQTGKKSGNAGNPVREAFPVAQR